MISRLHFVALLISSVAIAFAQPAPTKEDDRPVEDAAKQRIEQARRAKLPTLWLIGDSTVKVGTAGQRGWGEEFDAFFDLEKVNVVNRAIGGRSSRTFLTDGRWDDILKDLKRGDIVIMQFGHNDAGPISEPLPVTKATRVRGTIRGVGDESEEIDNILTGKREVVHSYGWYLRKYVRDTQAKGATPVVCSLVPRKVWSDGKVGRSTNSYASWAREVAVAEGAWFVDLHEIIARGYEQLGAEKVEAFFADARTHTTVAGAQFNAACVVSGLKSLAKGPWTPLLAKSTTPVKAAPQDTVIAAKQR